MREMADRGTFLVPTLSVNEAHRIRGNPMQQQRAEAVADEYADLVAVRGDSLTTPGILEEGKNLALVLKGGTANVSQLP